MSSMATMDIVRILGLAALPFTFYFAWTRIGYKVDVQITLGGNRHSAYGVKQITLINRKDRSIAIFEAFAVSNDAVLTLKKFNTPLVLKAYEAATVEVPEASAYFIGNEEINLLDYLDTRQLSVCLAIPSAFVKCRPHDVGSSIDYSRKKKRNLVIRHFRKFNGRIYSRSVKYAVCCTQDGVHKTFFIDSSGFID